MSGINKLTRRIAKYIDLDRMGEQLDGNAEGISFYTQHSVSERESINQYLWMKNYRESPRKRGDKFNVKMHKTSDRHGRPGSDTNRILYVFIFCTR
jgi:hypothetical protein